MWSMRFDTSSPETGRREASASIGLASGFAAAPRDCALAEPAAPAAKPAAAARCKNCRRLDRLEFIYSSSNYLSRLVSRRWTHGDELKGSALGPRSVVVHLIGDIVDDAARSDSNDVVLIELRPRADQESSGQNCDESLVGMRVRLAPIVGTPFVALSVQACFGRIAKQSPRLGCRSRPVFPLKLIGQFKFSRIAVDGNGLGTVEGHHVS